MNDHIYETHASMTALKSIIAFIIHTMPEDQKDIVVNALEKLAGSELINAENMPLSDDITSKTIEKINQAYKDVFNQVLDLSGSDIEPDPVRFLQ